MQWAMQGLVPVTSLVADHAREVTYTPDQRRRIESAAACQSEGGPEGPSERER